MLQQSLQLLMKGHFEIEKHCSDIVTLFFSYYKIPFIEIIANLMATGQMDVLRSPKRK